MFIWDRIKQDHDKARDWMKRIEAMEPGPERRKEYAAFSHEMLSHHKVEESVFYATVEKTRKMEEDSVEMEAEHHAIDILLEELEQMPQKDPFWKAKFHMMTELIEHHMDEEEEEVFPEAREVLSEAVAEDMARHFDTRKKQMLEILTPMEFETRVPQR